MNIFEKFREKILSCIGELVSCGVLPCDMTYENITVEVPRDKAHGEISSNVAMALSKQAKMRPQEIAKLIAELLKVQAEILDVSIAGPGFLNITAKPELWHEVIRDSLVEKDKIGICGDWCRGDSVLDASISGALLADKILGSVIE